MRHDDAEIVRLTANANIDVLRLWHVGHGGGRGVGGVAAELFLQGVEFAGGPEQGGLLLPDVLERTRPPGPDRVRGAGSG